MGIINQGSIVSRILGGASGGTDTSDATAVAGDIRLAKTAYGSAGTKLTGTLRTYTPPMMQYDGDSGFYELLFTSAGNLVTGICTINGASASSGGGQRQILRCDGPTNKQRLSLLIIDDDHATTALRDVLIAEVKNSSGTAICRLLSSAGLVTDGGRHVIMFAFDGDNGNAVFRVDGNDTDDTGNSERVAPTIGTLETGASSAFVVGSSGVGGANFADFQIGYVWHTEAYLTNYADFMSGNNPLQLGEADVSPAWPELGGQPKFGNEYGFMENNKGSEADMTKNATISVTDFVSA